jgi:polyvinyl alcohol dehydrogenase (cytochrome)
MRATEDSAIRPATCCLRSDPVPETNTNDQRELTVKHRIEWVGIAAWLALVGVVSSAHAQDDSGPAVQTARRAPDESHPGHALYRQWCAACHDNPQGTRAPHFDGLRRLSAETLRFTLTEGPMRAQAAGMSSADREQLIAYLADSAPDPHAAWAERMQCSAKRRVVDLSSPPTVGSFGLNLQSHRRMTAQQAGLTSADLKKLRLAWAVAFPQVAALRSQPIVVGTTLFIVVGEAFRVYALDSETGCVKWTYKSETPLRTSPTYAELPDGSRKVLMFGDTAGRVHQIDAQTGTRIWVKDVRLFDRSNLTAAPLVYRDRAYIALSNREASAATNDKFECCRTSGAVVALDLVTGERIWKAHTMEGATLRGVNAAGALQWGPSGAPIWANLTLDEKRGVLYAATGENLSLPPTNTSDAILAIDLQTGEIRWSFQGTPNDAWNSSCGTERSGANCPPAEQSIQRDWDFGGAVVIAQRRDGRDILLAGQKSGHVWALDPDDNGKLLWVRRFGQGTTLGGVHFGLAIDGERVFAPINDSVRPNRHASHEPGMNAMDIDTGRVLWRYLAQPDCENGRDKIVPQCGNFYGLSSPPLVIDKSVVSGAVDGRLRIFDAETGKVVWEYDTVREFKTIDGTPGRGGQIDNGAYVAANGTLYVQSGYGRLPGNVLLAFRPRR